VPDAQQYGGAVHVTVLPFDDYRVGRHLGGGQLQCGAHPRRKRVSTRLRCVTGFGTDSSGADGMVMVLLACRVAVAI